MEDDSNQSSSEPTEGLTSTLETGRERFLAHAIVHSLECGRRTAADFVRHFPPSLIMEGLQEQPELRADLLVSTTGTKRKVALKKSWLSCADDLQIALDESETTADAVVSLFTPDDRVRYLNHQAIWGFITEGDFWKTSPSRQKEYAASKQHMAFLLARALEDELISHADIVDGITVEEIASRLPKSELGKIIKGALACGKRSAPFREVDLLGSMPPEVLVNYVPLFQVWDAVIDPRIAQAHGYRAGSGDDAEASNAAGDTLAEDSGDAVPPPQTAVAGQPGSEEDPQRWTKEFESDSDFVDATDLLDDSAERPSTPPAS